MNREIVGSRLGELSDKGIRIRNHQVHVKRQGGHFSHGFDNQRADGHVRHEMSIHDIDVQPVGACLFRARHFLRKMSKVRRQNRRRDTMVRPLVLQSSAAGAKNAPSYAYVIVDRSPRGVTNDKPAGGNQDVLSAHAGSPECDHKIHR